MVDAMFTIIQDYNRHKSDKRVNVRSTVQVLNDGKQFKSVSWQDVRVGDIVKVRREQRFPCDLVLLAAIHEDGGLVCDAEH